MAEIIPSAPDTAASDGWIFAGPTSSFVNVDKPRGFKPLYQITGAPKNDDNDNDTQPVQACKILQTTASPPLEINPEGAAVATPEEILIFQYRGKFHAIDHQCPHMQHPLSRAKLYDIEDAVGIQCPKHRWAFNLSTGGSVKPSAIKMNIWEVQVREPTEQSSGGQQVWVRKQQGAE